MATLNLGRLKPVFRSTWNNATAYNIDDIVVRNNQSYISIQAGTNQDPATATAYWTLMAAKGSDGTDVGATLQNKEIAFKTNAGAVDGIPIGTANQFLKVNSGATGYEFGAVSSDYVYLGGTSTSNTTDLHVDLFSADYDIYEVFIHNWYGSSVGNGTQIRFNTAANTPQTGSNYRHIFDGHYWNNNDANNNQRNGDWDDSDIGLSNLGNASDANAYRLTFYNPFSSSYRTSLVMTGGGHEVNHIYSRHGQAYYNVAEQHTGFTLFASSGNIYIDFLKVYGIKTS